MQRNIITHSLIKLILLILLSLNLVVGCFDQINYIINYLPGWDLALDPVNILSDNLYIHPILVVLGIAGVFIERKLGFVLMLIYPFGEIFNTLIPYIYPQKFSHYGDEYRFVLVFIFIILINLLLLTSKRVLGTMKENILLNVKSLAIGLLISSGLHFLYDKLTP